MLNQALIDRYKCPESVADFHLTGELSRDKGFFRFGPSAICYGRTSAGFRCADPVDPLYDSLNDVAFSDTSIGLPFDPSQMIDDLRFERYAANLASSGNRGVTWKAVRRAYYALRPLMPVAIRKRIQRLYFRGWQSKPFPRWPVDRSVEDVLENVLLMSMKAKGINEIPFVWFWPEGAPGCAVMTHDVESTPGRDFCAKLMDIDDSFGIKASFQIVPELRYEVPEEFLKSIRERGFEVLVQDFNHDGHLFSERNEFLRRAKLINEYGKKFGATGFRAAVLYRNTDWLSDLDFSYDMSVPNVAHLDPQPGGCCTLFPYFIGETLEIPVTTTQDYSLFHILRDNSLTLWERQIGLILEKSGLMSFIIHPDYITEEKNQQTFKALLSYLARLREDKRIWIALPREVDSWWRARSQMRLISESGKWHIEGPERKRARLAFARISGDRLTYHLHGTA
jgi:hypothetical protein